MGRPNNSEALWQKEAAAAAQEKGLAEAGRPEARRKAGQVAVAVEKVQALQADGRALQAIHPAADERTRHRNRSRGATYAPFIGRRRLTRLRPSFSARAARDSYPSQPGRLCAG